MQVLHCLGGVPFRKQAFETVLPLNNAGRPGEPGLPHFQPFAPDEGRRPGNAQAAPPPSTIPPPSGKVSFEPRHLARQNTLGDTFTGKVRHMK